MWYTAYCGATQISGLALASEPLADHTNEIMALQSIFTLLNWSVQLCQMIKFFSEQFGVSIAKTLCSGSECCKKISILLPWESQVVQWTCWMPNKTAIFLDNNHSLIDTLESKQGNMVHVQWDDIQALIAPFSRHILLSGWPFLRACLVAFAIQCLDISFLRC